MNPWPTAVYTTKGLALQSKLMSGTQMEITHIKAGTDFTNPDALSSLTEIKNEKQSLSISSVKYPKAGQCKMKVFLNNNDLESGYTARQIGFYALDPNVGYILYFVLQCPSGGGTSIPSAEEMPGYTAEWEVYFNYGQADGVKITADPARMVTREELDEAVDILDPVKRVSGRLIYVDDAQERGILRATIYGESRQTVYKGYNILKLPVMTDTRAGLTVSCDGQIITMKGTAGTDETNKTFWLEFDDPIVVEPGEYLVFSNAASAALGATLVLYNNDSKYDSATSLSITSSGTSKTKEFPAGATFHGLRVYATAGKEYNATAKLMLDTGMDESPYEPYVGGIAAPNPMYPQGITNTPALDLYVTGKNIFHTPYGEQTKGDLTVSCDYRHIALFGKAGTTETEKTFSFPITPIIIPAGTTLTLSYLEESVDAMFVLHGDTNSYDDAYLLRIAKGKTSSTRTLDHDVLMTWLRVYVTAEGVYDASVRLQLEVGGAATSHEEYTEVCACLGGAGDIGSVGDVRDLISMDGSYSAVHRSTKEVVFDGTESWRREVYGANTVFACDLLESAAFHCGCISSHYRGYDDWRIRATKDNYVCACGDDGFLVVHNDIGTVDAYKAWLAEQAAAGTPLTVRYALRYVSGEPIPDAISPIMYDGKSVVRHRYGAELEILYMRNTARETANKMQDDIEFLNGTVVGLAYEFQDLMLFAMANATPIGATILWAGSADATPDGYLLCDGQVVSRDEYSDLFAVIGTTFGAGDGSTTFAVPDLRDRFVVGAGRAYDPGATGGEAAHTLTVEEMPVHTHSVNEGGEHTHTISPISAPNGEHLSSSGSYNGYSSRSGSLTTSSNGEHTHTINSAGGGAAHNNMPPYLAMAYIIRAI